MIRRPIKDYYRILGVPRNADQETIKSAYRNLAKKYHPDMGEGSSVEAFREIREAYEVLSDPQRRSEYDSALLGSYEPSARVSFDVGGYIGWWLADVEDMLSAFNLSELELDLFGSNLKRRSYDFYVELTRSEASYGATLTLELPVRIECAYCWGVGRGFGGCLRCYGSGLLTSIYRVPVKIPPRVKTGDLLEMPIHLPQVGRSYIRLHIRVNSW